MWVAVWASWFCVLLPYCISFLYSCPLFFDSDSDSDSVPFPPPFLFYFILLSVFFLFPVKEPCMTSFPSSNLILLLGRRFRLGRLFPITPHHDHAEKGAHHSGAEQDEDDGDADGPLAEEEEVLEGVVVVDEGLGGWS